MIEKQWSDASLLKSIPNPAKQLRYTMTIENPEVTFLGSPNQPDFAIVTIEYVASEKVIELKALKHYFHWFRDKLISYERFVSVVFNDLVKIYQPQQLKLTAVFNPRGGIQSIVAVDLAAQLESTV